MHCGKKLHFPILVLICFEKNNIKRRGQSNRYLSVLGKVICTVTVIVKIKTGYRMEEIPGGHFLIEHPVRSINSWPVSVLAGHPYRW